MPEIHERWLQAAICESDGLLCISRAVADDLTAYILRLNLPHRPKLRIGWFHCGSDLVQAKSQAEPQPKIRYAFDGARPVFLSVGTLEPRKAHSLALDAFDRLWAQGVDVGLCFLGASGWNIGHLQERIASHAELGSRLNWFWDAKDSDLVYAYAKAEAIICMSTAEGFGLPIAEAARLHRPVICSDIPVFREVGGRGAVYFRSGDCKSLADAVVSWLDGKLKADPSKVSRSSWADAETRIRHILTSDVWYRTLN